MSNEELVMEIQAGRRELLGTLWEQVERFIRRQATNWPHGGAIDLDDLTQAGYIALVEAVDSYTPERDMKFISWLAYHLKTAFNEASNYRSERQRRDPMHRADSLSRPLDDEDGGELIDILADPHGLQGLQEADERIWHEELSNALKKAIEGLFVDEREVIRRSYYRGQTTVCVARETAKKAYEVQRVERRALAALRKPSAGLLAFVEEQTPYFLHVGVARFNATHTSAVEEIVFKRDRMLAFDSRQSEA